MYLRAFSLFVLFLFGSLAHAAEDEAIIKQKFQAYSEAYNKHDAKALSDLWDEKGMFIHPDSNEVIEGRSAIQAAFQSFFTEYKDVSINARINTVRFPFQDNAEATGVFEIDRAGKRDGEIAFKAFLEKQNGQYVITEIRNMDIAPAPNQYQYLKELEWLIGEWIDKDEDVEIHVSYRWDNSKNLILGKFSVDAEGQKELDGRLIIAYDPLKKKIRSWVFDSDGTFGESFWTKKGDSFVIESQQVLADGMVASEVNIMTPIDTNSYKWEATNRSISGDLLPDIEPITIERVRSEMKQQVKQEEGEK